MTIGPYEILDELGRGATSVVYRARRPELGRDVALKVLVEEHPEAALRFLREARAAARLAGRPGIVAAVDMGEADGRRYIAMELVEGTSLDRLIASGDLGVPEALRIAEAVARALADAHAEGLLHRDVKPANVLVGRRAAGAVESSEFSGESRSAGAVGATPSQLSTVNSRLPQTAVFLTDFGLTRESLAGPEVTRITGTGAVIGTPAYVAPEQALGLAVDGRTDVYALGATLYEALTGSLPFTADTVPAVLAQVLHDLPPTLRLRKAGLPRACETLVAGCLAKDPRDRYATAAALAEDIARVRRGEPALGPRVGRAARTWRAVRRRPGAVALVVAALGLAVGIPLATVGVSRTAAGGAAVQRTVATTEIESGAGALRGEYQALLIGAVAHLRVLEDRFHSAPVPDGRVAEALAAVRRLTDGPDGQPRAASAGAIRGLARYLAGEREAGAADLRAARAGAPDNPLVAMSAAHLAVAELVAAFRPSGNLSMPGHLQSSPLETDPDAEAAQVAAHAAVSEAARSPFWARMPEARPLQRFIAAALDLLEGRTEAAAAAFPELVEEPLIEGDARLLLGRAYVRLGRPLDAARAFEPMVVRGWPHAILLTAGAWADAAAVGEGTGAPVEECLRRARTLADGLLTRLPDEPAVLLARGTTAMQEARVASAAGRDPRPALAIARADMDRILVLRPADARALGQRAVATAMGLDDALRTGADPGDAAERATADFAAAIAEAPADPALRINRASFLRVLADMAAERRDDPRPWLREASADLEVVLDRAPGDVGARVTRAMILDQLADADGRAGQDPGPGWREALADLARARATVPDLPVADEVEAVIHERLGEWTEGQGGDGRESFRDALAVHDRIVARGGVQAEAHVSRAQVWRLLGEAAQRRGADPRPDWAEALAGFDAAAAANPGLVDAYYWRGRMHIASLEVEPPADPADPRVVAAVRELREAARRRAGDWRIQAALGVALTHAENLDAAIAATAEAVRLEPGARETAARLARLRAELAARGH